MTLVLVPTGNHGLLGRVTASLKTAHRAAQRESEDLLDGEDGGVTLGVRELIGRHGSESHRVQRNARGRRDACTHGEQLALVQQYNAGDGELRGRDPRGAQRRDDEPDS